MQPSGPDLPTSQVFVTSETFTSSSFHILHPTDLFTLLLIATFATVSSAQVKMRISLSTFALAGVFSTAYAQVYKGFNYGSLFTNNAPLTQQDFENRFNTARQLQGTSGFTSARLFTTIQVQLSFPPLKC